MFGASVVMGTPARGVTVRRRDGPGMRVTHHPSERQVLRRESPSTSDAGVRGGIQRYLCAACTDAMTNTVARALPRRQYTRIAPISGQKRSAFITSGLCLQCDRSAHGRAGQGCLTTGSSPVPEAVCSEVTSRIRRVAVVSDRQPVRRLRPVRSPFSRGSRHGLGDLGGANHLVFAIKRSVTSKPTF
jgi:hypothetical protein